MKTKVLLNQLTLLLCFSFSYTLSFAQVPTVKQWDRTFGGSGGDYLYSLQQTSDGGYILGGFSNSLVSGNKTSTNNGSNDFWIVKIDASGNKQWDKT